MLTRKLLSSCSKQLQIPLTQLFYMTKDCHFNTPTPIAHPLSLTHRHTLFLYLTHYYAADFRFSETCMQPLEITLFIVKPVGSFMKWLYLPGWAGGWRLCSHVESIRCSQQSTLDLWYLKLHQPPPTHPFFLIRLFSFIFHADRLICTCNLSTDRS